MIRRLAALAAVAALVGCGSDRSTIERGGRIVGPNLTIYSSVPRPGEGLGRDLVDAQKLAIAQAGGRAGDFGINFVSIDEGPLGRDAPVKVAAAAAEQVIRDPQAIAVIGTLRSDTALTTVPLLNAAGLLQVSLGAGYPGFTDPIAPGEPERWFPSGHPTFAREVGDDVDQAGALVRAAGRRVAIEAEAGKVPEALADALRGAAGDRVVDDPAQATGTVYAGNDLRSAVGVAAALARENPRARIVFPDELTRAGIADRLPRAVRRRSVFVTSAPPPDEAFAAAFEAQYGRRPDPYAVLGYRAMQRVLEAIEAAGPRARLRRVTISRFLALPAPPTEFSAHR
jgi:ABC-type branched-subunit amino acid transport system substrate-binding protein